MSIRRTKKQQQRRNYVRAMKQKMALARHEPEAFPVYSRSKYAPHVRPLPQPKKPVAEVRLDREWKKGYACAVATLIRSHGAGTEVDDLIRAGLRDLKYVDPYDCEVLQPEMERLEDRALLAKTRMEAAK